ncbi:nucleoside deaminase [Streptomyces sp. NPDC101733]|uniref:nucleoside deaminase n=1 Tax=unclassified Streptomyces TaxID=2593676 RepID=UPI00381E99A2
MTTREGGFEEAWEGAPEAVRRTLGLAYESLTAGGLAVGAVLTDPAGRVLAQGRNEAYGVSVAYEVYEAYGVSGASGGGPGAGPLRGTPLAHAEMNALGAARTGWDLGSATLWSTQEPCSMCVAAAAFTGVGEVRYLAPDPWALSAGSAGNSGATAVRGGGGVWPLVANLMFLRSVAVAHRGPAEPAVLAHHRTVEPETVALHEAVPAGLPEAASVAEWLAGVWSPITGAAATRADRLERQAPYPARPEA